MENIKISPVSEDDIKEIFEVSLPIMTKCEPICETVNLIHDEAMKFFQDRKDILPHQTAIFSTNLVRSRQCDAEIENYGALLAEISLQYTSQMCDVWRNLQKVVG